MKKNKSKLIFIIQGPSGAGKGTLTKRVFEYMYGIPKALTTTTRPMREGEKQGNPHNFVPGIKDSFKETPIRDAGHNGVNYWTTKKELNKSKVIYCESSDKASLRGKKELDNRIVVIGITAKPDICYSRIAARSGTKYADKRQKHNMIYGYNFDAVDYLIDNNLSINIAINSLISIVEKELKIRDIDIKEINAFNNKKRLESIRGRSADFFSKDECKNFIKK